MTVRSFVSWEKAIGLALSNRGYTLIGREGEVVRSQFVEIPKPLVVALNKFVSVKTRTYGPSDVVPKRVILERDGYVCQYCFSPGKTANTVDHIIPKSRGGKVTWENAVAACFECNGAKANHTPKEAGMKQPTIPRTGASATIGQRRHAVQEALGERLKELVL